MIDRTATPWLTRLRRTVGAPAGGPSDGDLLDGFLCRRDEGAFAALVQRHGPMVLGVCQRVLGHAQDAEDAFQATFLVLARKGAVVRPRERVGAWLHGVAYRTALKARTARARRRRREQAVPAPHPAYLPPADGAEAGPVLDQALARLPERYRAAVVLCELEGRPRKEAAQRLGIPEGTLSSRLAQARRLLARRLGRYGLALPAALAAVEATAGVPASLLTATLLAARPGATGGPTAPVAALTEGVLRTMLLQRITRVAGILVLLTAVAAGLTPLAHRLTAGPPPADPPAPKAPAAGAGTAPAAGDEFTRLYALPEGAILKRVADFTPARMDYYQQKFAHQAKLIPGGPKVMFFRMTPRGLQNWGMNFSGSAGEHVPGILAGLIGLPSQEVEGDPALFKEMIQGDWVVREGAPAEKVVERLEVILREECKLPVKLTFRAVERPVVVVSGTYQFRGRPGQGQDEIDIYARELVPNSGAGGGSGDFRRFLDWVGSFVDRRLVSDVAEPPPGTLSWRYHRRSPATAEQRREDTDPALVFQRLNEQTGLTFTETRRKVRVLFVERAD